MNTKNYMIIVKGKIKTSEIKSCVYDKDNEKWDIEFNNGKIYSYISKNVEKLEKPQVLTPTEHKIKKEGKEVSNIKNIYKFKGISSYYFHICFEDGREEDYSENQINIVKLISNESYPENIIKYMKEIACLSDIKNEETGERILAKRFEKLSLENNNTVLNRYLNPSLEKIGEVKKAYIPIFPFGCNNSQYKAVKNAMENQISIIQGPPGTGKTQTILNIIANILMQGKTVQVVSNNNSATENIYEKLSSSKYNLGFIVAALGNSKNKKNFIEQQEKYYPDFSSWKTKENLDELYKKILEQSIDLKVIFDKREKLASLKQELSQLVLELKYFHEHIEKLNISIEKIKAKKNLYSNSWMALLQESQLISEYKKRIVFLFKVKVFFKSGIRNWNFYRQDIANIIYIFQLMYYKSKQLELKVEIENIEKYLENIDKNILDDLSDQSMIILKDQLARKYEVNNSRKIFSENDLWKNSNEVLEEYPVILSTTFSSKSSLNSDVIYDYLIMDEASQVDIVTGALALSCARNAIIVGDTKQLPNVVTTDIKNEAKKILDRYKINEGYQYTKSFLQSILDVIPNVTQTLLREHYRCHPKIINFCNQKFYGGNLIIMTKDNGEEDVLSAVKTVVGNHERNHYSQRQIDVIKKEIMDKYILSPDETGIITPYKNQVEALNREINNIDAATVHKFQGKEKENIIISTVDDIISDFADDPYLINVAVSRAKKKLILVTTGNKQIKEHNIVDLINYIKYNNFEVIDSKVYSIFDYLYKQYTKERILYLQRHKKISEYDSENLMYSLITEIITDNKYLSLDVVCHYPLNMLIKNSDLLNKHQCKYISNPATHLDFLIYNKIGKIPVLAIEVDGYEYHKKNAIQEKRDLLKDNILELYQIPFLRLKTNGSGEKEKILEKLKNFNI